MIVVWVLIAVTGGTGLALLGRYAYAAEPHWVAKDGRAFDCRVRDIGDDNVPVGRWIGARAFVDGSRLIVRRHSPGRVAGASAHYAVFAMRTEGGHAVFMVDGENIAGHGFAQLRVPVDSRAIAHIEALISASSPDRGTDPTPRPPDPC